MLARDVLRRHRARRTPLAVALVAVDTVAYAGCFWALLIVPSVVAKFALGVLLAAITGRLFVLGHDACHGSFTPSRRLNDAIARFTFLPSLTPLGRWRLGHNQTHHAYTNRRGLDFVWAPFSPPQWRALPLARRLLERIYRSAAGHGLYYFIDIWCGYLLVPRPGTGASRRVAHAFELLLMFVTTAVVASVVVATARYTGQNPVLLILVAMTWPFAVWNVQMGFAIYHHHTDPAIRWYRASDPAPNDVQLDATQHVIFPGTFNAMFHNIFEHSAHHVDPLIPLYNLPAAQTALRERYGEGVRAKRWTLGGFLDTVRRCKLYDYDAACWTDFRGNRTSP
ncbi:MAG: fatty acid desaturase [Candidatus Eremiobacteraeota bacterium]|nr:fatty acid desaturase [Candidatus Eremiobacteraeota bacterium]